MAEYSHPFRAFTAYRRAAYAAAPAPRRQFMPREVMLDMLRQVGESLPLLEAPDLPWKLAERVHDVDYLRRWRVGDVTRAEERAMGFPWTPEIVERGLGSSGATFAATQDALSLGLGINFGGGTHHAYRDHAEGFSFLNDVVISAQWLLDNAHARRIAILDFDVHQGNGTAAMFAAESRVLTVSLHGANNYPFTKEKSALDVNLPDKTTDQEYLTVLDTQVAPVVAAFKPDFAFYLAGADVLQGDQLGRLSLTLAGMRLRDERVFRWAARQHVPLVLVLAGGYNRDPQKLVQARLGTVQAAIQSFRSPFLYAENERALYLISDDLMRQGLNLRWLIDDWVKHGEYGLALEMLSDKLVDDGPAIRRSTWLSVLQLAEQWQMPQRVRNNYEYALRHGLVLED